MILPTPMIVLIVIVLVVLWAIWAYNRLIKFKNMVREAWSGIEVQLKRRFNLIPNLVEIVKGYADHEARTLEQVTNVRTGLQDVNIRGIEEGRLSKAIKDLLAVAEDYPDLKASQNFLDLQDSLEEIEQQIQLARRYYNGAVRDHNILVESFPSNFIASGFGFPIAEFFEIELARQREVEQVDFSRQ